MASIVGTSQLRKEDPELITGAATFVDDIALPGDVVVCLGAGNITQWAYSLSGELQALRS